jgi:hypothetical protein
MMAVRKNRRGLRNSAQKGYRADNPAASIDRPILDDRPVGWADLPDKTLE